MVKLIGVLLILSSLISLFAGAFIDSKYGSSNRLTGNVVSNIGNMMAQPKANMGFPDYLGAVAFSYSIISLIMGVVFLIRV